MTWVSTTDLPAPSARTYSGFDLKKNLFNSKFTECVLNLNILNTTNSSGGGKLLYGKNLEGVVKPRKVLGDSEPRMLWEMAS